jgi:exopolysaccharide production protein ExoZ
MPSAKIQWRGKKIEGRPVAGIDTASSKHNASTQQIVGIQVLRGAAAAMVVLHHTLEEASVLKPIVPEWITLFGASGVDLFFVISGFIMVYTSFPVGRPPLSPLQFINRRATRIYPFYWVCLAAMLALFSIGFFHSLSPTILSVIESASLFPTDHRIIGISWTLSYEIYFYLIFACALIARSRIASVAITFAALLLFWLIGNSFTANSIVFEFVYGMALAYLFYKFPAAFKKIGLAAIFGFALLCVAALAIPHTTTNGLSSGTRWWAWGVPAAVAVAGFVSFNHSSWERIGSRLGDASYAIYLTQPLVMVAYAFILTHNSKFLALPQLLFVPAVFAFAIVVGIASHVFIEIPLISGVRSLGLIIKRRSPVLAQSLHMRRSAPRA